MDLLSAPAVLNPNTRKNAAKHWRKFIRSLAQQANRIIRTHVTWAFCRGASSTKDQRNEATTVVFITNTSGTRLQCLDGRLLTRPIAAYRSTRRAKAGAAENMRWASTRPTRNCFSRSLSELTVQMVRGALEILHAKHQSLAKRAH